MNFPVGSYGYIAVNDLETANDLLSLKRYNSPVVHTQQCIEKILKHYIKTTMKVCNDDESVMRSHKLVRLVKASGIPELLDRMGDIGMITDCYFDARYPGVDYTEYTADDALRYFNLAVFVFDTVCKYLEKTPKRMELD